MNARPTPTPLLEPPPHGVPVERLYRVGPALYRSLVERGLIVGDEVRLGDGLLYRGGELYRMPPGVYERVAELGLLGPEDGTEFLDGLLVRKMTKGNAHILTVQFLRDELAAVIPRGWIVLKEDPVRLSTGPSGHASEPEPDLMVVRGSLREYLARDRTPDAVSLVVEVAESSLDLDRQKLARYAWANIPVAWLLRLNERLLEVHTRPSGPCDRPCYQEVVVYGEGDEFPVTVDGREAGRVAARDVLP